MFDITVVGVKKYTQFCGDVWCIRHDSANCMSAGSSVSAHGFLLSLSLSVSPSIYNMWRSVAVQFRFKSYACIRGIFGGPSDNGQVSVRLQAVTGYVI